LPREFSLKDFIRYPAQRVSPGSMSFSNTLSEVLPSLLHMAEAELPEQNRLGDLNIKAYNFPFKRPSRIISITYAEL
jgi:hypothetical protein